VEDAASDAASVDPSEDASDVQPTGTADPDLPEDIDPRELDAEVRGELRTLGGALSAAVAKRLVASGTLLDDDPEGALAHAMVARRLAPRVASVREAVGLAAYHAGQWQSAIGELRTYHRITGRQTHLAVIADCERALGRPERAVDLYRAADLDKLAPDEAIELLIVASGARADLGQLDAASAMLQVPDLRDDEAPWAARLRYAFADTLRAAGRTDEAREWFARAADVDDDLVTDAAERLLDLDGVVIDDPQQEEHDAHDAQEEHDAPDAPDAPDAHEEPDEHDEPEEPAEAEPATEPKPAGYAVIFAAPEAADETPDGTPDDATDDEPDDEPEPEDPPR